MDATVAVDVPLVGDARLKHWAKVVDFVDVTKSDGWAYEGEFVADGGIQDLDAPCVLLVYGESGSRGNPQQEARAYVVDTDGTLSLRQTATGRAWARTLRDTVADLVDTAPIEAAAKPWDPVLMGYSDEALREELDRRSR
ncbi:MAG: hypothetical protein R3290_01585 [Acidimicrobiia bacterium]|nr:hypothetical protein [Acidimicrobiia bacterium]